MENELFGFLTSRNIFKRNGRFDYGGSRILASEKTEQKRAEKNKGKFVWLSKNLSPLARGGENKGTFKGTVRRDLIRKENYK